MAGQENTPNYIKQLPWYAQTQDGNAQYQVETALFEPKGKVEGDWYDRGIKGVQANSYRKGACENCGAMGHHKKECTERPRKLTAKHNNKNIAPDDVIKNLELKWDAKRDRWNGYEADRYKEIIEEFEKTEEIRKKVKLSDGTEDPNSEYKSEVDLIALADLPSKHQKNQKFQGLTGLRNREDRAKYLLNLDPNVQDFNPKSRTMNSEDSYADELTRMQIMGEKYDLIEQDKFAFEQVEKHHAELSSAALPTITEKIYKSVKQKRQGINSGKLGELMRKYKVEQPIKPMNTVYEEEEYNPHVIPQKPVGLVTRSKYEEDVLVNNHTCVWGSWYNPTFGWGYQCCYAVDRNAQCLGIKGREKTLARELRIKAEQLRKSELLATKEIDQQQKQQAELDLADRQPQHVNQSQKQEGK